MVQYPISIYLSQYQLKCVKNESFLELGICFKRQQLIYTYNQSIRNSDLVELRAKIVHIWLYRR